MSFGEYVFSVGFVQKTVKEDLFVKRNHVIPQRNQRGKTLENTKRQPVSLQLLCRFLHCLLDCIYTVLSSRFDPRVQN
jgi:hypothetical protein